MSRYYRMLSLLDVDAALPEHEQDFWKDVLARCGAVLKTACSKTCPFFLILLKNSLDSAVSQQT